MIDARGQSCPIPVVMVQDAVKKGNNPAELQVKVDARVCVENITRYAASQGYTVSTEEENGEYLMTLKKS
ncbi:MAG: sulfurtransferase TusA family protein [Lachnospiraceae bacterium]|nr:sulfurtransferase TusA family protein [Lachnospiraceae bacterium]